MGKIMEKIIGVRADKKEYREQMARAKRLPHAYREMFDNIKKYIWSVGPLDGGLDILYGVIELFEQSAADGQKVREVTGEDIAKFCDELLQGSGTWQDKQRQKLNAKSRNNNCDKT